MYSTHNEGKSLLKVFLEPFWNVYINKLDDIVNKYNNT